MFWKVYMFIAEEVYYNGSEVLEPAQEHCAEPVEEWENALSRYIQGLLTSCCCTMLN
jgi:hypothetical protein